ncbi:hypothetical protein MC885_005306 [Smutsia gigantea]|nr:hypothetical protein MC885_005306 [Smutsia gigantea]
MTLEKVSLAETAQDPSAPQGPWAAPAVASDQPDSAATSEKAKKIKNLKKKLWQVEELQHRIQAGEISQPSKEQLEKLARRRALQEELEDLELGPWQRQRTAQQTMGCSGVLRHMGSSQEGYPPYRVTSTPMAQHVQSPASPSFLPFSFQLLLFELFPCSHSHCSSSQLLPQAPLLLIWVSC